MENKRGVSSWTCPSFGCGGRINSKDRCCDRCGKSIRLDLLRQSAAIAAVASSSSSSFRCSNCGAFPELTALYCNICKQPLQPEDIKVIAGLDVGLGLGNDHPKLESVELIDDGAHQSSLSTFEPGIGPIHRVIGIEFTPMTSDQIVAQSVVEVKNGKYTDMCRKGYVGFNDTNNTIADNLMAPLYFSGIYEPENRCKTCQTKNKDECPGHFGHLQLPVPIISPVSIDTVRDLIDLMCIYCCHIIYCNSELLNSTSKRDIERAIRAINGPNKLIFHKKLKGIYFQYITNKAKNPKKAADRLFEDLVLLRKSGTSMIVCIHCQVNQRIFTCKMEGKPNCYWVIRPNKAIHNKMTKSINGPRSNPDRNEIYNLSIGAMSQYFGESSTQEKIMIPFNIIDQYQTKMKLLTSKMTFDISELLMSSWPIAPPQVRPTSAAVDKTELVTDKLSLQYDILIKIANEFQKVIHSKGSIFDVPTNDRIEQQQELQSAINGLCYNDWRSNKHKHSNNQMDMKAIFNRQKGKRGLYRESIMGKRVNYSFRTVLSPDPCIGRDQVSLPIEFGPSLAYERICSVHTKPMIVAWMVHLIIISKYQYAMNDFTDCSFIPITLENDPEMKQEFEWYKQYAHPDWKKFRFSDIMKPGRFQLKLLHLGPQSNPIELGMMINDRYSQLSFKGIYNKMKIHIKGLCDGDEVTLPFVSGDIVIIQRYPSLRDMAASAYYAVLQIGRKTIGMKLEEMNVKGADCDGDEVNGHVPISEEAKSEAKLLMLGKETIESGYAAENTLGFIQDAGTLLYKITNYANFVDRAGFMDIINAMGDDIELTDEDLIPAILKPKELWTGWQIAKIALAHHKTSVQTFIPKKDPFSNGVLPYQNQYPYCWYDHCTLAGVMKKSNVGPKAMEKDESIFMYIARYCDKDEALKSMDRLSKAANAYLEIVGFSVGLSDIMDNVNHDKIDELKEYLIEQNKAIEEIRLDENIIEQDRNEAALIDRGQDITDKVQKLCMESIKTETNAFSIMIESGAKGKPMNLGNIMGQLGLQMPYGELINTNINFRSIHTGRVLYCHPLRKLSPKFRVPGMDRKEDLMRLSEWGYIRNSFINGLKPNEFWWMCQFDRPAISSTSRDTPISGYSCRQMIANLNGVVASYETLVMEHQRDRVIQFEYGHDGTSSMRANPIEIAIDVYYIKRFVSCNKDFSNIIKELFIASCDDSAVTSSLVDDKFIVKCNSAIYMKHEINTIIRSSHHSGIITDRETVYQLLMKWLIEPLGLDIPSCPRTKLTAVPCSAEMLYFIGSILQAIPLDEVTNNCKLDRSIFVEILKSIVYTWFKTRVDPGSTVGVMAATAISEQMTQNSISGKRDSKALAATANETIPLVLSASGSTYRFPASTKVEKIHFDNSAIVDNDNDDNDDTDEIIHETEIEENEIGKDFTPGVVSLSSILAASKELAKRPKNITKQLCSYVTEGIPMGKSDFNRYQTKMLTSSHINKEAGNVMEIHVIPSIPQAAELFAQKFLRPITIGMCVSVKYYTDVRFDEAMKRLYCKKEWSTEIDLNCYFKLQDIFTDDSHKSLISYLKRCEAKDVMVTAITVNRKFIHQMYSIDTIEILDMIINSIYAIAAENKTIQAFFPVICTSDIYDDCDDDDDDNDNLSLLIFASNKNVTELINPYKGENKDNDDNDNDDDKEDINDDNDNEDEKKNQEQEINDDDKEDINDDNDNEDEKKNQEQEINDDDKEDSKDVTFPHTAMNYMKKFIRRCCKFFLVSREEASLAKVVDDKIYIRYPTLKGLIKWLNGSYVQRNDKDGTYSRSPIKDYVFDPLYPNEVPYGRIYFDPYRTCCFDSAPQIADLCGISAANIVLGNMYYKAIGPSMNIRHAYLLADYQSCTGNLEPFTRHSESMNNGGPIKAMSYENQIHHTTLAVRKFMKDDVKSLASATLLGHTIPVGTGYDKCKLLLKHEMFEHSIQQSYDTISRSQNGFADIDPTGFFMTVAPSSFEGSVSSTLNNGAFSPLYETKEYSPSSPIYSPNSPPPSSSSSSSSSIINNNEPIYSPSSPQYHPNSPEQKDSVIPPLSPIYAPTSPSYSATSPIPPINHHHHQEEHNEDITQTYMDPRFDNEFYRKEFNDFLNSGIISSSSSSSSTTTTLSQSSSTSIQVSDYGETKRSNQRKMIRLDGNQLRHESHYAETKLSKNYVHSPPSSPPVSNISKFNKMTGNQLRQMHNEYVAQANRDFPMGFICPHGPVQPGIPCPGCQFKMVNHRNKSRDNDNDNDKD